MSQQQMPQQLQSVKMEKQAKLKLIGILVLFTLLLSVLIYAIATSLETADNLVDDDGYLDLRGICTTTAATSDTHYNITNATLYSNVNGTWLSNKTLQVPTPSANISYYFNFTNYINQSAEGTFKWNIECNEQNSTGATFDV